MKDCARTMGQIELVLAGEAEYVGGKVKLPKGIDSWEVFCIMNHVEFAKGYRKLVETHRVAKSMSEQFYLRTNERSGIY